MKNVVLVLFSILSVVQAFAPYFSTTAKGYSKNKKYYTFPNKINIQSNRYSAEKINRSMQLQAVNSANVKRISVCTEELCQCQGEGYESGGAADATLETLKSLDLSFPIDDVGCLGACGMGSMVAIDYENGDSILVDGLQSTLLELGIEQEESNNVVASASEIVDNLTSSKSESESVASNGIDNNTVVSSSTTTSIEETETEAVKIVTQSKKEPKLVDVRDRMRQEAADMSTEVPNPWLNMASYLAKKAFGSSE